MPEMLLEAMASNLPRSWSMRLPGHRKSTMMPSPACSATRPRSWQKGAERAPRDRGNGGNDRRSEGLLGGQKVWMDVKELMTMMNMNLPDNCGFNLFLHTVIVQFLCKCFLLQVWPVSLTCVSRERKTREANVQATKKTTGILKLFHKARLSDSDFINPE